MKFEEAYIKLNQQLEESAKTGVPYPQGLVNNFIAEWSISEDEVPMTESEYNSIKSAYYGF